MRRPFFVSRAAHQKRHRDDERESAPAEDVGDLSEDKESEQGGEKDATTRAGKKVYLHVLDPKMQEVSLSLGSDAATLVTAFGKTKNLKWKQDGETLTLRLDNDKDAPDNIYEITLR